MKSFLIALLFIGFAVAEENSTRSLDSGLQAGPFIQTWRSLLYKIYSDVPPEYFSHVQQLIDLSYQLDRTLGTGNIDGIMREYGKSIDIAKTLLPNVKDPSLQSSLSDRIKDFEELVRRLGSGEKNSHTIQGLLNRISDNVAHTVNHVMGAVHDVISGIMNGIFNLINFGNHRSCC